MRPGRPGGCPQQAAPAAAAEHDRQGEGQHEQSDRQGEQVGVGIAVKDGEEGELGDRLDIPRGRDEAAGDQYQSPMPMGSVAPPRTLRKPWKAPHPAVKILAPIDHGARRNKGLVAAPDHAHRTQVAEDGHAEGRGEEGIRTVNDGR